MTKRVIIIRHGQSEKDKANPLRGLTKLGQTQIKKVARKLNQFENQKMVIVATDTPRAQQSADILSNELNVEIKTLPNMRIENLDFISDKTSELFNKYFKLSERNLLPQMVPTPQEMAQRFLDIIDTLDSDVVIIVGHGVALETFANYQDEFLANTKVKELDYGEFVILRSKDG